MIQVKVKVLKDMEFRNVLNSCNLVEGDICTLRFKNEADLNSHLDLGNFDMVLDDMVEERSIPIIHPTERGVAKNELHEILDLSGNLDKLTSVEPEAEEVPEEEMNFEEDLGERPETEVVEETEEVDIPEKDTEDEDEDRSRQRRGTGSFGRG